MAGIGRHPAVAPPRHRAAARRDPLLELLQTLRPEESLSDARDHALLLIGWKAALRSDDLARLQMADLHASEQGLSVFIARSKTDQTGHGTTLGIAAPSSDATMGEGSEESTLLDAGAAWVRWRDPPQQTWTRRTTWRLCRRVVGGGPGTIHHIPRDRGPRAAPVPPIAAPARNRRS
jgi:hypothetical protein